MFRRLAGDRQRVMLMPLTLAPLDRTSTVATPGITVGMRIVT